MMKILTVLIAVTVISVLDAFSQMPSLNVYRNDGGFNKISQQVEMLHAIDASGNAMVTIESEKLPVSVIDSITVRTVDIPTIHIDLKDYPEATTLWEKDLYLNASISVNGNGLVGDVAPMDVSIKGRGNSTWNMPKKPMRLKFTKKTEFCGLSKSKNYVLLANYIDNSLMRNAVVFKAAELLGVTPVNHMLPCDVYFNGHLLGSYLLTEKIGINSASVDIDENTGVLLELSSEYDEEFKFRSPIYNLPVMIKDPDLKKIAEANPQGPSAQELLNLWKTDFSEAEALGVSLKSFEAFDLEAFVDYYLLCNFCCNDEIGFPKSVYMYKEKLGEGKYKVGPLWDYDSSFNYKKHPKEEGCPFDEKSPNSNLWLNGLFDDFVRTPGFKEAYASRFEYFKTEVFPVLLDFIYEYSELIEPSAKQNGLIWTGDLSYTNWLVVESSYDTKNIRDNFIEWIKKRMDYLESVLKSDSK